MPPSLPIICYKGVVNYLDKNKSNKSFRKTFFNSIVELSSGDWQKNYHPSKRDNDARYRAGLNGALNAVGGKNWKKIFEVYANKKEENYPFTPKSKACKEIEADDNKKILFRKFDPTEYNIKEICLVGNIFVKKNAHRELILTARARLNQSVVETPYIVEFLKTGKYHNKYY